MHADGQRDLAADVPVRQPGRDGPVDAGGVGVEHVVEVEARAVRKRVGAGEHAEDEAAEAVEDAREAEPREQAVDAVRRLADVLDDEDRAREVGQEGRPEQGRDEREVAADERALGLARREAERLLVARPGEVDTPVSPPASRQKCASVSASRCGQSGRDHRAREARQAGLREEREVERRDVRVADDERAVGARGVVVERGPGCEARRSRRAGRRRRRGRRGAKRRLSSSARSSSGPER